MIRAAIEGIGLFLAPFAVFALALLLTRRRVLDVDHWSAAGIWLASCGLALVAASFILAGLFGERHTGAFEPAHMENGRVVPGRFR